MSPEVGYAAVDATCRSAILHEYPKVKFKYAGGEALIRFPVIMQIHEYARQKAYQAGLEIEGIILSNGTLLQGEMLRSMKSKDLGLMISIDGLNDAHNRQRYYIGGKGTVTDVIQAIKLALEYHLIPVISITVTGRNAGHLAELVEWIIDLDLPFTLNFYRENDQSMSYSDLKLDEENIISGMLDAYKIIEANLPQRSLLGSLVDKTNLSTSHTKTCGVGQSYLVFDYQGYVSKCHMDMGYKVASIKNNDLLMAVKRDQKGIQNMSVDLKEGCRSCEWRYWCTGGCPLATYRATGRYDIQSPNCNIYKTLYPEAMRLEGLRLLKYGVSVI
jgi:uncharacterized protein